MKNTNIAPKGHHVEARINLRTAADGSLVPVGAIPTLVDDSGKPIFSCVEPDGTETVFYAASNILTRVNSTHHISKEATFPGHPLCGVNSPEGVVFMTDNGAYRLEDLPNGQLIGRRVEPESSPLTLTSRQGTPASYSLHSITLNSPFVSGRGSLGDTDVRRLRDTMCQAYTMVHSQLLSAGAYLQPVIGFLRFVDSEGAELYRSCPVVLGSDFGLNCMQPVTCALSGDSSGINRVSSGNLAVTPYSLVIHAPEASHSSLLDMAATVEVWVTPQLHPVDFSQPLDFRVDAGSSPSLSMYVPGTSAAMTPLRDKCGPVAASLLPVIDKAATPVAVVPLEAENLAAMASAQGLTVIPTVHPDVRTELASLRRHLNPAAKVAESAAPGNAPDVLARCAAPHSFTASTVATAGDTVVWGNPSPRLFSGYTAAEMGHTLSRDVTSAVTVVDMPGERVVTSTAGEGAAPDKLSPLLCYPLSTATRLSVRVRLSSEGEVLRRDFPLTVVPGCRYAFWLNPRLCPVDMAEGESIAALSVPAETRLERSYEGTVVTARSRHPLHAVDAATVDFSGIRAVMPVRRDSAGWNFSHSRFCCMTASGVYSLLVDAKLRPSAPRLLVKGDAHKGIDFGDRFLAVVGTDLVGIVGSKATPVLHNVKGAGWCRTRDELWVLMLDGALRVYENSFTDYYVRGTGTVVTLFDTGRRLLVGYADGSVADADAEHPTSAIHVGWHSRFPWPGERASRFKADISATHAYGTVALRADNGTDGDNTLPVTTLTFAGSINCPPAARVRMPRRHMLSARVDMDVSADFRFYGFKIS